MKHRILIFDSHRQFLQALSSYLEEKYGAYFEVMSFDDGDALLRYLETGACQMCFIKNALLSAYQTECILAKEIPVAYFTATKREQGIFQFQSVQQIAGEIFERYLDQYADELPALSTGRKSRRMKMIGFYSPARHIYQSAIALTMGQLLAKEKKVLYLNFEPYSAFEYLMQKEFTHDLSDLLFYLKEDAAKFSGRMEGMICQVGNLYYIPPIFSFPDLKDVSALSWKQLLSKIGEQTEMEIVILDFTEQVDGLLDLLPLCDEIYTGYEENGMALAKVKHYEKMLSYMKREDIVEKTQRYTIPVFREIPRQASLFTHSELARLAEEMLRMTGGG